MKTKLIRLIVVFASLLVVSGIILFYCVWNGVIIVNDFSANQYPVKGIDVSSYQGEKDLTCSWGVPLF